MAKSDDQIDNFDDLFGDFGADGKSNEEDAEDARIRELERLVSEPLPVFEDVDQVALTEKQRKIKDLEDQLAKRASVVSENAAPVYEVASDKSKTVLLHVVHDGFVASGETWYRGQEIEIEIGGAAYQRTKDRLGNSWVDLAGDVPAQYQKWGRQYLALGPFVPMKGERFDDDLVAMDAQRNRAVPLIRF